MSRAVLHLDTGSLLRGGQRQVLYLMLALRKRGWRNVLAAPQGSALARRAEREGFEHLAFAPRGDLDLPAAFRLGAAARKAGLDLWHAHTARAQAAARLALGWPPGAPRRRLVVTRRTAFAGSGGLFHRIKYRDLRVDSYIAISRAVAAGLLALGLPAERIRLIPSAVDPEPFLAAAHIHLGQGIPAPEGFDPRLREELREGLGVPASAFLVGAAGALDTSKGFDLLIQAASTASVEEPRLCFAVAGEGPQRPHLESMLSRLGLGDRFRFLGRRKDLPLLLAAFDCLCMPSREEGLGSVVLEAFAAGLPVLASDAGGLAELLQPGLTGFRFPRGDVKALTRCLLAVASEPEECSRMARTARQRALSDFGITRMAEAVERVYDSLVMSSGPTKAGAKAGG